MSRLTFRARLTAAFVLAMLLVLIAAGLFVYLRVGGDLDEAVNEGLRARAEAVAALETRLASDPAAADPGSREDPQEGFAQVLTSDGRVVDAAGQARAPALPPAELVRMAAQGSPVDRRVAGIDGPARVLVERLSSRTGGRTGSAARLAAVGGFVIVGQSLEDRTESLTHIAAALLIGGPLAIVLASLLGYVVARASLRPVEAMGREAAALSLDEGDGRLPVPAAQDELRRLAETLNDMLGRLRRSFEREQRFVADASHEIRTPVAVVKLELEGALRSRDYGPEVREALVAAVEECDRLSQLAEDLLVIARAAGGRLPVRPERLDAASVLEGVRERFVDRAREQRRELSVDAPDGLTMSADPGRLRQALGNLVDNALRHGEADVALIARERDGGVELEVSDRGPGFSPRMRERAFERFARDDEARSGGGAGLGLSIVRAVVDAHGGEVRIVPGEHGIVRVWLPAPAPRGPHAGRPRAPESALPSSGA